MNESDASTRRLEWFRKDKFGMFIHWGVYAVPAGQWKGEDHPWIGEWIMKWKKIPVGEYEQVARQFNPEKFDAGAIAQLAHDAGMKYLVITSKHHDGFAMWPSKASPFNIADATPFKRDPLKELQVACAGRGLKYGFYYSQAQDWHEPEAAGNDWDFQPPTKERNATPYLNRKVMPQVHELLENYGPLDLIWFDTPTLLTKDQVLELERVVREKQPNTLINSRLGHGLGDYRQMGDNMTPTDVYAETAWEIPATLNDTWGYKTKDHNWKSPEFLVYRLVDVVSKGGNYLLNIGPRADGTVPEESAERLRAVGRWIKTNGESIYGTTHSPFTVAGHDWRCTQKPGTLYIHLLRWPAGGKFELPGLRNKVTSAFLLADPTHTPLETIVGAGKLTIKLPGDVADPYDSVLVLKIEGDADVDPPLRWDAPQKTIDLAARDCSPHGQWVRYSEFDSSVGGFTETNDKMLWHLLAKQAGKFNVEIEYARTGGDGEATFRYSAFDHNLDVSLPDTGGQYKWMIVGTIELPETGLDQTRLSPLDRNPPGRIRVRGLRLTKSPETP
ncbi:MAG: alpha-L-fucosidase [Phycisphaerales bacterium]|nr:alpha-L-fucosidase [Phycisphaerales bacterium]